MAQTMCIFMLFIFCSCQNNDKENRAKNIEKLELEAKQEAQKTLDSVTKTQKIHFDSLDKIPRVRNPSTIK